MKKSRILIAAIMSLSFLAGANGEEIQELKTFYFGNSFLENTMVGFHPILGKSAGKEWDVDALIHPGVPIWVHAVRQMDPESGNYKKFHQAGENVDAIVMLQFGGMGLHYVTKEMWGGKFKFDEPTEIGDLASCAYLIREYLKMNPGGRAYVYTAWPNSDRLGDFRARVKQEVQMSLENPEGLRGRMLKQLINNKTKAILAEEVEPVLEQCDFAKYWLAEDYIPATMPMEVRKRYKVYSSLCGTKARQDKDWKPSLEAFAEAADVTPEEVEKDLAYIHLDIEKLEAMADPRDELLQYQYGHEWPRAHSRPHNYALLEGLKKEFPEMWKENRLGMIPVGDVMLALHRKIKEGAIPPLKSVQQFSEGHMRSGLPRYMLGATFYAVLFRDHPKNLDASIYAERENYIDESSGLNKPAGKFYVHIPDLGRHIPITPERKKIVDETIWEVVVDHPYTGITGK